jgi:hypothetical protein
VLVLLQAFLIATGQARGLVFVTSYAGPSLVWLVGSAVLRVSCWTRRTKHSADVCLRNYPATVNRCGIVAFHRKAHQPSEGAA